MDPYDTFNVGQCDTYQDLWTWDVLMSCGQEGQGQDQTCTCPFAEELMEMGRLSCDDGVNCPQGCPICNNCLRILGCTNVPAGTVAAGTGNSGTAAAVALFTVLLGAGFCVACKGRNKRRGGKLDEHLMDIDDTESQNTGKNWMVPLDSGLPSTSGKHNYRVWLIPDNVSVSGSDDSSVTKTTQSDHPKQGKDDARVPLPRRNVSSEMEASMRRLRTQSTDIAAANRLKGFFMSLVQTFNRGQASTHSDDRHEKTHNDEQSVSADQINQCTDPVFPDILLDLPIMKHLNGCNSSKSERRQQKKEAKAKAKASREKKMERAGLYFPDLLHGSADGRTNTNNGASTPAPEPHLLPPQKVPTIPTDLTSNSHSSKAEDAIPQSGRSRQRRAPQSMKQVDGVWLIPLSSSNDSVSSGSSRVTEESLSASETLSDLMEETSEGTEGEVSVDISSGGLLEEASI
jgi:hypothetical protein